MHQLLGQDGCGRIGPHAAGVRALVIVERALVVLRRADGQHGFAVGEHEERRLLALHEFLDHHFGPGRAKTAAEHVVDGGHRSIFVHCHDHALAGSQSVGLDHDGRALFADIGFGGVRIREMPVS